MSLTPAEKSALDALFKPEEPTLADRLHTYGISVDAYREAINAEREYVEYILAVAIEDLFLADSLDGNAEVVHIARKYWPAVSADD